MRLNVERHVYFSIKTSYWQHWQQITSTFKATTLKHHTDSCNNLNIHIKCLLLNSPDESRVSRNTSLRAAVWSFIMAECWRGDSSPFYPATFCPNQSWAEWRAAAAETQGGENRKQTEWAGSLRHLRHLRLSAGRETQRGGGRGFKWTYTNYDFIISMYSFKS